MNERLDEIIKNIVYIDKGASELRGKIEEEINEKKKYVLNEINRLQIHIELEGKSRVRDFEVKEIEKAREKAERILDEAKLNSGNMLRTFESKKREFIIDLFHEILNTKNI